MNWNHFIGTTLGNTVIVLTAFGLVWRFLLYPHMVKFQRETVVEPIEKVLTLQQTAIDQLTKNGGQNNPATVPDVAHELREFRAETMAHLAKQDRRMDQYEQASEQRWAEHRAWSDEALGRKQDKAS